MSLPRILVSKICASYPYVETVNGEFSVGFPIHFTGFQKKKLGASGEQPTAKGHIKVSSTSMSQKRPSKSPVELLAFLVDLLLKESKARKIWKITGDDRWSLETFLLQK